MDNLGLFIMRRTVEKRLCRPLWFFFFSVSSSSFSCSGVGSKKFLFVSVNPVLPTFGNLVSSGCLAILLAFVKKRNLL